MNILGVDPGVTTGFALLSSDGENWRLERRWELRWKTLGELYNELLETGLDGVDEVAMELMLAYKQASADEKVEAQAIVKLLAEQSNKPLHLYAPGTIRSAVMGTGKATPAQIKATMRHMLGMGKTSKPGHAFTEHQQDAVAVALCHLVCSGGLRILRPQGSVAA